MRLWNTSGRQRGSLARIAACGIAAVIAAAMVPGCDNTPKYFNYESHEFGFTVDLPAELKDKVEMTQTVQQVNSSDVHIYEYKAVAPQMAFAISATVKPPFYAGRPFVVDAFQYVRETVEQSGFSIKNETQLEISGRGAPLLRCQRQDGVHGEYSIVEIGDVIFELSITTPSERFLDIPHARHFFESFRYVPINH